MVQWRADMVPHTSNPRWPADLSATRFASTVRTSSPDGCSIGLLGLADDTGVTLNHGRAGACEGPRAFREALARFGVASPAGPPLPIVFDAGDIVATSELTETHRRVTEACAAMLDLGLFPVGIGGGHDLTFPFVRAVAKKHPGLAGAYADAHLDVRDTPGSGMPFRRLIEDCGVGPLRVHGLVNLANSTEHTEWFLAHGGTIGEPGAALTGPRPSPDLFVSFDLDVIDGAHAPGVSAMNPCGWDVAQAGAFVLEAARDPGLRCFDIMELCPAHDDAGRTARVAAFLFLTFLRGFAGRAE